jgi:hypothetical protein
MDGKRFQGASEHLDNHSVMGDAFEAYLAAADARYSAYSRRFSIFGLLLRHLAPSFEASIALRDTVAMSTGLAVSGLSNLRAKDLVACEGDLLGALESAQRASEFEFVGEIGLMLLAVRDAKMRQPRRARDEKGGDRFRTPQGRRACHRAKGRWGSAQYCVMCERLAEAHDPVQQNAQRVEPGARLSGNYCWQHKPFTGSGSGNRCNSTYRRGLERLNDYQLELARLYLQLEGHSPGDDDWAARMWGDVLRSLSWRGLTIDQLEGQMRRLANVVVNVGTPNRLDDRRKTVLMMNLSYESVEAIGSETGLDEREVLSEMARMPEWLPDEVRVLLDEQISREARLASLWCSK